MAIRKKGKLRDLGIVFKPSFKCFKNKKNLLYSSDSKTRMLVYRNIYIISSYNIFVERLRLKKKWSKSIKKHANCREKNR